MTGEIEYRDYSGEKISLGDRVCVLGGGDDPKWRGTVVEIYPPEPPPWKPEFPFPDALVPPTLKIRFEDGEEDEFSGWRDTHWSQGQAQVYDFDDLEKIQGPR